MTETFIPLELIDDTSDLHFVPAPCQVACPIGTDAPSYIGYIWEGNFEGALEAISATNPFSSICGRVCDAPCEPACRRADSDGPIAIRNLKRFIMDALGPDFHLPPVEVSQEKSIGIVGGGPAGLTAAQDLAEAGYKVHVYEMSDRLGGMMVWGIPAFRLPVHIIEEDINRILKHCPGIEVHLNSGLGDQISIEQLKQQHDAVLLTIGAWWGKKMNIPDEEDARVKDGVTFLREVNGGARPEMPETVVVIGGGDVAMDACRSALRLPGCEKVKVLYRRGPDEIPARRDELEGAIKEKIEFIYHTQPTEVIAAGDVFAIRCVRTELGEPEADGRRRPVTVPGSEHDIQCGLIIAAVGQKTESEELESQGLMKDDQIVIDEESTRVGEEKMFATGDSAYGPSTIVNAMYLGHRSAYYIKAYLEGRKDPIPYSTPYRTRRVPISQDPDWEIFNRVDQAFHGVGQNPIEFPEIESTYNFEDARKEAARCYRCDAENGTHEYSVNTREDIFVMARSTPEQMPKHLAMLDKRLANRNNPFPEGRPPTLDDIHFLPANLSRLVIDPYREQCKTRTPLGSSFALEVPFAVAGFDDAPLQVKGALGRAVEESGCVYIGSEPLAARSQWIQLRQSGDTTTDPNAAGLLFYAGDQSPTGLERAADGQLLGLGLSLGGVAAGVPLALEKGCDFLLLDATADLRGSWPEVEAGFQLEVLRDAIDLLREMKQEEQIDVFFYGGVRSGTDAAKVIGLGGQVIVLGVSVALAMGGSITEAGGLEFASGYSDEEYCETALNFLTASTGEATMMARGAGKTNVHSLEPEDLRSITLATSRATGLPLAGATGAPV